MKFYAAESGKRFSDKSAALKHFRQIGQQQNLNPHPLIHTKWYLWQNPDAARFQSIADHLCYIWKQSVRDPSPTVDLHQAMQFFGCDTPHEVFELLSAGVRKPGCGVYSSYAELVSAQKKYRSGLAVETVHPGRTTGKRRYLVFVQTGTNSLFDSYCRKLPENRSWDLLLNWYSEPSNFDAGEYSFHQKGTKFTGICNLFATFPKLFDDYEYIFFLDDDIELDVSQLDNIFATAERHDLDLCQTSLTKQSHCVWPVFFTKGKEIRWVNGVEIMMPIIRGQVFRQIASIFAYSVSGFGLDLLLAKLAKRYKWKCAILDNIPLTHTKKIDESNGAYYNLLRQNGINQKAELWYLIEAFDLEIGFHEV